MTTINPLLFNQPMSSHDRLYENLAKNAHTIKPNENKAVLVDENIFQSAASALKDSGKDVYNFSKAIKTGEITDNNLGRINDLGMKLGSLLIASYLALNSKTKTDAAMKFVGGGAFLASMSLWPKIFINTPAKLIHGVDVDKKYISAQGDKKDLYLDNQYIVWDITGIKEEDREKHRMVALQNRTLNLATVAFGAPLMTSLIGNVAQPFVYNKIVEHNYKKASKLMKNPKTFGEYIQNSQSLPIDSQSLDKLFKSYEKAGKSPDKQMFEQLSKMFNFASLADVVKDKDDINILKEFSTNRVVEQFQDLYQQKAVVRTSSLENILQDFEIANDITDDFEEAAMMGKKARKAKLSQQSSSLSDDKIKQIINDLGENPTISKTKEVLTEHNFTTKQIDEIVSNKQLRLDSNGFYETVKKYNKTVFSKMRGNIKAYLDALNPIAGSKYESITTKTFNDSMTNLIKKLDIKYSSKNSNNTLKGLKDSSVDETIEILSNIFKNAVGKTKTKDEYIDLLKNITGEPISDLTDLIDNFSKESYLNALAPKKGIESLDKAIFGTIEPSAQDPTKKIFSKGGVVSTFVNYINCKKLDLLSVKVKPIICANFERRLKEDPDFKKHGSQLIDMMRKIAYDGTASLRQNSGFTKDVNLYQKAIKILFDKESFKDEEKVMPGIRTIVGELQEFSGTNKENFFRAGSFATLMKQQATKLYNDKSWLRKFGKMAIILSISTLLIQPFFGKVKNPDNQKKDGGAK